MMHGDHPTFASLPDGGLSCHATTVGVDGICLALTGPSGVGKSGTAAQMVGLGAGLVCDDMTILHRHNASIMASAPVGALPAIELWGIGITPVPLARATRLMAVVVLGPSRERMPRPERIELLGVELPMLRHPARFDLAAKLMVWLRAQRSDGT